MRLSMPVCSSRISYRRPTVVLFRTVAIVLDQDGRVSAVTSAAEVLFDDRSGISDPRLLGLVPDNAPALDHVLDLAPARLAYARSNACSADIWK
jgi:hypothetical protein